MRLLKRHPALLRAAENADGPAQAGVSPYPGIRGKRKKHTMNNKTKIMLGLSALTAGTLAAGATGTLAWFTTNKTATATYQKVTVRGTQGNLNVAIEGVTTGSGTSKAGTTTTAEGGTISDVSSKDGLTFYQPDWKGNAGKDAEVNSIKNVSDKEGYFVQYLVNISNASAKGAAAINVSLTGLTITVRKDAQTSDMTKWVRVAILPGASKKDGANFLQKGNEEAALYQTDTSLNQYVDGTIAPKNGHMTLSTTTIAKAEATLATPLSVGNALQPSTGSAHVGVAVWVEGTNDEAQDDIKNAEISIALTFSAKDVQ